MIFTKKPITENRKRVEVNFLQPAFLEDSKPKLPQTGWLKKIVLYGSVFILITIVGFTTQIIISGSEATKSFGGIGILSQIKNLLLKDKGDISGTKEDRVNILLLGIGGDGHQGPYLTDTIILVSLKPEDKSVALISIPRDLYVTTETFPNGTKINSIYARGNAQKERGGGELIKQAVGDFFGIAIHYYGRIDFNGFIALIDTLGGIDIHIDTAFTDNQFPAKNFTTKKVRFDAGENHLDGITALQFVRSRHGTNGEAGDFARARRQQKTLLAIKNELVTKSLLKPHKINKLITLLGKSIETDMELWEIAKLTTAFDEIQEDAIARLVLDDDQQGALKAATGLDGSFLLLPRDTDQLKAQVQNIFDDATVKDEKPTVVLQNGTKIAGFAQTTKAALDQDGFTVLKIENAEKQSYAKTVVYDLTAGKKQASLKYFKNRLDANISHAIPPEILQKNISADFVIILGTSNY